MISIKRILFLLALAINTPYAYAQEAFFDPDQWGSVNLVMRQSTSNVNLEAILGTPSHERLDIYNRQSRLRQLGRPVGRLDFRFRNQKFATCTATLIEVDTILTNYHCIPNIAINTGPNGPIVEAEFMLGYYNETRNDESERFEVHLKSHRGDAALDFSVLNVSGSPGQKYGTARLKRSSPQPGASFLVIHHPLGSVKYVTRGGCRAGSPNSIDGAQLFHLCDTLPGSSGAPIFSDDDGSVIAIHRAGARFIAPNATNYGVLMSAILEKLDDPNIPIDSEKFGGFEMLDVTAENQPQRISRNEWRKVQVKLNLLGYEAGQPDGIAGPNTKSAIARFQGASGLAATGALDRETWSRLESASPSGWPETATRVTGGTDPQLVTGHRGSWVYLGVFKSGWSDAGFRWPGYETSLPEPGEVIVATRNTNIRADHIRFNPQTGWSNAKAVGAVKAGQAVKIDRVYDVTSDHFQEGYYWARLAE